MKFVSKQLVIFIVALMVMAPAFAEGPTKGTKSYQSAARGYEKTDVQTTATADAATPQDVQNIAPAAGAAEEKPEQGKSLKEELRLPRKN